MIERWAVWAYRVFLAAFPAAHRDRYADEMVEAFRRELAGRRGGRRGWRNLGFAGAACLDALGAGLGERRRRRADHAGSGGGWHVGLGQDLSHATRGLAKSWTFSFVCLFSIAVGLGVVLALVLLLRVTFYPPFEVDTEGLVELYVTSPGRLEESWSYPDFADVVEGARSLDVSGWAFGEGTLRASDGEAGQRVRVTYVSTNYFETLGVTPIMGRGFAAEDGVASEGAPVVVSHGVWQNRLGAIRASSVAS